MYAAARSSLPPWLRRHVLNFEAVIEDAVRGFAASLPAGAMVLDAGAGEGNYSGFFGSQRYVGIDLAVGDAAWDYSKLDVLGDLAALPFRDGVFAAALNIVTLEHVAEPARVLCELARILAPGGRLLLIVPHEWEEHQQPHDYYRYTRFGLEHLLKKAGFGELEIRPVGGFFRLLSRRLFNALQFFPAALIPIAAIFFVPPALLVPLLEPLDRRQNFTLGYICSARICSSYLSPHNGASPGSTQAGPQRAAPPGGPCAGS